jgi:UDP:flavonoid glycosyltransferase YjiC (YdhE family)
MRRIGIPSFSAPGHLVVLPVTCDQPGVGARIEWVGAGRSVPVGRLTVDRLRAAVRAVLGDPNYRARARRFRSAIDAADGVNRAADLIGAAFGDPSAPADAAAVSGSEKGR